MSTPLLAIRSLRAAYGNIEALKGIDLDVQRGEIVALIGANGAGKSTLMMTIFGRPAHGRAKFCSTARTSPIRRRMNSRACASPNHRKDGGYSRA